jgi:hypothetical protein
MLSLGTPRTYVMLSQAERRQKQVKPRPSATVIVLERWSQCNCSGVVPPSILCVRASIWMASCSTCLCPVLMPPCLRLSRNSDHAFNAISSYNRVGLRHLQKDCLPRKCCAESKRKGHRTRQYTYSTESKLLPIKSPISSQ